MEIGVIVILAVMLFPPRELPKIARGIARLYGQVKRTADDFKSAILDDEDLNAPIREIKDAYNETRYQIQRAEQATKAEINKARMEARMAARLKKEEARRKSVAERRRKAGSPAGAPPDGAASAEDSGANAVAPTPGRTPGGSPSPSGVAKETPRVARSVTGPVPRGATPPGTPRPSEGAGKLPEATGTEHVLDSPKSAPAAVPDLPAAESADATQGVA